MKKASFNKQEELIAYAKFLDQCQETGHFPALIIGCTMSPEEAKRMEPKSIILMASCLCMDTMMDTINDSIIANDVPDKFVPSVRSQMAKALLDGFKHVMAKRLLRPATQTNYKNVRVEDSPLNQTNNEN